MNKTVDPPLLTQKLWRTLNVMIHTRPVLHSNREIQSIASPTHDVMFLLILATSSNHYLTFRQLSDLVVESTIFCRYLIPVFRCRMFLLSSSIFVSRICLGATREIAGKMEMESRS
jgi:hypothetical protein